MQKVVEQGAWGTAFQEEGGVVWMEAHHASWVLHLNLLVFRNFHRLRPPIYSFLCVLLTGMPCEYTQIAEWWSRVRLEVP